MKVMKSAQCIEKMQAIAKMIDEESGSGAADKMFTFVYYFTLRLAQNGWGLSGQSVKK